MTTTKEYPPGEKQTMKVFVTRAIPNAGIQFLEQHCTVDINSYDRIISKQELLQGIQDKDGLLCLLTDPIDKVILTAEPKLKVVANYAVGYDNIDIITATKHGISICNTPDVLTDTTAELAWALVFSVTRRILEADAFTRAGTFRGWEPLLMLGRDVTKKTLGIIGLGRIGKEVAKRAEPFGMIILAYDPYITSSKYKMVKLQNLLKQSDIISLHVPLNEKTRCLLDKKEFRMIKKGAVLINTSRGDVINETELIRNLKSGKISFAGLDVFSERLFKNSSVKKMDNVILTPHIGAQTIEAKGRIGKAIIEKVKNFQKEFERK